MSAVSFLLPSRLHAIDVVMPPQTTRGQRQHRLGQIGSLICNFFFSVAARRIEWTNRSLRHSLFVGCLTSQQHASVSQGRICSDNCKCCHTEIEAADQTFYLNQSHYADTGPTSPCADPITPGAWQGSSHWSANFLSHWYDSTRKNPVASGIRTPDFPLSRRTP